MKRLQVKVPLYKVGKVKEQLIEGVKLKAEVTVFMSMLLVLLMGFIGALMESATVAASKSYERGITDLAVESVFAEYHTTLLEEFHIFAVEMTYETGNYDLEKIQNRLMFYGADETDWEVTQLQLLSDAGAASYEEQILTYMKEKYGIDKLTSLFGDSDSWETQRVDGESATEESKSVNQDLEQQVEEAEGTLSTEDNPLDNIEKIKSGSILSLVVEDMSALSTQTIDRGALPSNRSLNTGIDSYKLSNSNAYMNRVLVSEYILDHFQVASDALTSDTNSDTNSNTNSNTLQYEVEYILEGSDSDQENLEGVVQKLLVMRTGANYVCLTQSTVKKAEVSALALTIATASAMPYLSEVIEQALLLAWAYGESIMDIRSLLSGHRVELVKSEEAWQLDLSSLMDLGGDSDSQDGLDMEDGLSYEEYLRILLYLEDKDSMVLRSLDMVEQRLRVTNDLSYFLVDQCMTQIEYQSYKEVSGGYTYEFPVAFTYK